MATGPWAASSSHLAVGGCNVTQLPQWAKEARVNRKRSAVCKAVAAELISPVILGARHVADHKAHVASV